MDYAFGIMSKDLPDLMLQRFSLFQEFYSLESAVQFLKKKKNPTWILIGLVLNQ